MRGFASFLLMTGLLLASCARYPDGTALADDYVRKEGTAELRSHFLRGYQDRIRSGKVVLYNSATYVPPEGKDWPQDVKRAYWLGYFRGGAPLKERQRESRQIGYGAAMIAMLILAGFSPYLWQRWRT